MWHLFGLTIVTRSERAREVDVMRAAYALNQVVWMVGENNPVPSAIEETRKPLATALSFLPSEDQIEVSGDE